MKPGRRREKPSILIQPVEIDGTDRRSCHAILRLGDGQIAARMNLTVSLKGTYMSWNKPRWPNLPSELRSIFKFVADDVIRCLERPRSRKEAKELLMAIGPPMGATALDELYWGGEEGWSACLYRLRPDPRFARTLEISVPL